MSAPPPLGPRYRLFNIGPKVGPGPPLFLFACRLKMDPLFKNPGSAPVTGCVCCEQGSSLLSAGLSMGSRVIRRWCQRDQDDHLVTICRSGTLVRVSNRFLLRSLRIKYSVIPKGNYGPWAYTCNRRQSKAWTDFCLTFWQSLFKSPRVFFINPKGKGTVIHSLCSQTVLDP